MKYKSIYENRYILRYIDNQFISRILSAYIIPDIEESKRVLLFSQRKFCIYRWDYLLKNLLQKDVFMKLTRFGLIVSLALTLFFPTEILLSQSKSTDHSFCAHTYKNINGTYSVTMYPSRKKDCKNPKNVSEWKKMDQDSDKRLLNEYKKYKSCKKEISKFRKKIKRNNPHKPNRDDREIFSMRVPRTRKNSIKEPINEVSNFLSQLYDENKLSTARLMTPSEYTTWLAWKSAEKDSPCSGEIQKKGLTSDIWKNIKATQEFERFILTRSGEGIDKAKEDAIKFEIHPPETPTYNVLSCSYGEGIPEISHCKTLSENY